MKVLVIGSGGREHALSWKLAQSPNLKELMVAPGNAGTALVARNIPIPTDDSGRLLAFAKSEGIDLVVVGPEAPLCAGLADQLRAENILVFGPSKAGAELEGSKELSKSLMVQAGIPTAAYRVFRVPADAKEYLSGEVAWPVVIKASGLASGKGVIICKSQEEALSAVEQLMVQRVFQSSGDTIVVEDFLAGDEVSVHCLTDGRTFLTLPTSQDHKRVLDDDQGPNTGGMGAISPASKFPSSAVMRVEREVIFPTLHALSKARRPYSGALYAGLMVTRSGPKVLEFNVRFGDPETQVILPRLRSDFLELLVACARGDLDAKGASAFDWDPRPAVCVVLAAEGYPGTPRTGDVIEGWEDAARLPDVHVFHGATQRIAGRVVSAGGRVMGVTALGKDLGAARERAYEAVSKIHFLGMHYRKDIGKRAVALGAS